ncbi:POT family MFS transporter [Methylicorpusculum sp.]|uniref:POT family MFS transporter n=1 Tax=Methylicorpusculum sp. TaxID=2713644 RepID=UPI00271F38D8|nr:POT family MFS transporter [Methylicorpusculum sp.]MDO8844725.1 POT family MFS transporter [Methylicorpusculum sp.]
MDKYPIKPESIRTMPSGIPYIIANEAAERFSYYGMRAILVVFMTQYLLNAAGKPDPLSEQEAQAYFHLFVSAVYFMPLLGAVLADGLLGKYRTILFLSLVYCFGHLALAFDHTLFGLLLGQGLIAVGAGGIKPCVSAHVGDQFNSSNSHLINKTFGWFYFSINLGAFTSMLIIPWLLKTYGPSWAFGLPGIVMATAMIIFWSGRYRFAHIPPAGVSFLKEVFSPQGRKTLFKLVPVYLFIAVFWALFEQIGSSWVLQAQKMDRHILGIELLPSQIQAANPLLIMILVPLFNYYFYPFIGRYIRLSAMTKIKMGLFLTVGAFAIPSVLQMQIDIGLQPSIGWQLLGYCLLTAAEVMISVTCLEFSYTQAPNSMKSFIMAFYSLSIAFGNLFTSAVNFLISNAGVSNYLEGANYFWFFTALMLLTSLTFLLFNSKYEEASFYQGGQNLRD